MKKLIYLIVLIVAFGLVVVGCIPVVPPTEQSEPTSLTRNGINYYVRTDGNDGNDGSANDSAHAWLTISYAISQASSGDTINVAAGIYTEFNITVDKQLTLLGAQADVDPRNGARAWDGAGESRVDANHLGDGFVVIADNVVINGFTVINAYTGGTFDTAHPGRGIFIVESSNCEVKYNILYNNTWRGIRIGSETDYVQGAANNSVHHNLCYTDDSSVNGRAGISLATPNTHNNTIEYNEIHHCDGGIVPTSGAHHNTISYNDCHDNQRGISLNAGANYNTVEHNTSTDNSECGITHSASSSKWGTVHHNIVRNNTLDGNGGADDTGGNGIGLSTDSHNNLVENNTITNSGDFGINLHQAVDNIIRGNTVNNSGRIGISLWDTCSGNVVEDNHVNGTRRHQGIKVACWAASCKCDDNIVRDNEVQNATSHGIFVVYATNTTINGNTVHGNGGDGIKIGNTNALECSSTTTVNWNCIYCNTGFGVNNHHYDGGVPPMLDAINNCWGDESGPEHSTLNPTGTGDSVSDNVEFCPWALDNTFTNFITLTLSPLAQPVDSAVYLEATLNNSTSGVSIDLNFNGDPYTASTNEYGIARFEIGYQAVGVYNVSASVNTLAECLTEEAFLAVYDASEGFVTGGGWIDSPAGASTHYPDAVGKATFGFVSKYKKGAAVPTGKTEFQFKAGDLNFHSDSYDWLVITGGQKAMYKGTGTVNGADNFGFMLSAIDDDTDMFRIKIWDKGTDTVIYDNGNGGSDGTELAGGQIVIHKGK